MKKHTTRTILVILLCMQIILPTFASPNPGIDISAMLPYIQNIIDDADTWGLDSQNIEDLYIGQPIHHYDYLENGQLKEKNFVTYPVFANNNVVFLIYENNDGTYQIANYFIESLSNIIGQSATIIYENGGTQLITQDSIITLIEPEIVSQTSHLQYITQPINLVTIKPIQKIQNHVNKNTTIYATKATSAYLNVPKLTQAVTGISINKSEICWAASTASIGNYLTGKNIMPMEVAQTVAGSTNRNEYNVPRTLSVSINALKTIYGITYSTIKSETKPTFTQLYNTIANGYPAYIRWHFDADFFHKESTHQTVARGADTSNQTISIMDPINGAYILATYTNNTLTYNLETGRTGTAIGYATK